VFNPLPQFLYEGESHSNSIVGTRSCAIKLLLRHILCFVVCPGKPADIVFIMDESSSIWPVHFARQREFLANLTESFDVGPDQTRISVVTFADKVTLRFGLADYKKNEDVSNAIAKIDQKTGGKFRELILLKYRARKSTILVSLFHKIEYYSFIFCSIDR